LACDLRIKACRANFNVEVALNFSKKGIGKRLLIKLNSKNLGEIK
jgi:hypothetical protein